MRPKAKAEIAPMSRRAGLLVGAGAAVLAEIYAAPLVYPLRLFTVLLHEGGHAAVTVLTGGKVVQLAVHAEESGYTLSQGGIHFLILNGGYLGSLLGGLLLTAAPNASRGPCVALGAVALVSLWWIPLFSFGFLYTALVGVGLIALGMRGSHTAGRWVLRGLGVFVAADAVRDILSDFGRGDAALLAGITWIPAPVWSLVWLVAAIAILVWAIRRS